MSKFFNRTAIVSLLIMISLAIGWTLPVSAIESEGIGALPANPRADNPRTKSIFVYELKSGESAQDAVNIINNTKTTKHILVYAVDSEISSDGAFACEQAVETKDNVGSWISLTQSEVEVKSFETVKVPFTIALPAKADVGEHNGCIVIQDIDRQASTKGGIALSFRSALRVAVTVPGKLEAKLSLLSVKQQGDAKQYVVTPTYKNSGNVSLDTNIVVKFVGLFGTTAGNPAGGQFPILPEGTSRFNFEMSRPFWGGLYTRTIDTTYKPLSQEAAQTLGTQKLDKNEQLVFLAPKPVAAVIELVAIFVIGSAIYWFITNRRTHKMLVASSTEYKVKKGDDLQSIARKHRVEWKHLAKMNKVKPPYSLEPGQTIKVPAPDYEVNKGKSKETS